MIQRLQAEASGRRWICVTEDEPLEDAEDGLADVPSYAYNRGNLSLFLV